MTLLQQVAATKRGEVDQWFDSQFPLVTMVVLFGIGCLLALGGAFGSR